MARIKFFNTTTNQWEYADRSGLSRESISTVVNESLQEAKDTGEFDGKSAYAYAQESGYTGTEEEFAQKLAEEALVAVTDDVTPAQVAEAISNGRYVRLVHIDGTLGTIAFNNFIYIPTLGAVISSAIVYLIGKYIVMELVGNTQNGTWSVLSDEVATANDIPVPVIGTTAEITPSKVAEAIEAGQDVSVTYNDATYGAVVFSSFMRAHSFNCVASSEILQYDGAYILVELLGSTIRNEWALLSTQLAQYSDVPVPVIGTTAEITPSKVKELMDAGNPFAITHTDSNYGSMLFNSFVYSQAVGNYILSTTVFQVGGVTFCAQLKGDFSYDTWAFEAFQLATTADIPESMKNPYALTINGTSYDGSEAVNIESIKGDKGDKGDTGQRGTGLLAVTSTPSSYTTAVGGITPKYRMALSTIKSQSGATEVLLGDTIRHSYYHYPIAYLDASYAYCTTRVSIRGATGAAGGTPVRGTDYWTDADKQEIKDFINSTVDEKLNALTRAEEVAF